MLHARFFLLELACEAVTLYYPSCPEGGLLFKHTGCLYILDLVDFGSFRVHISIALKDMNVAGAIATPSSASCHQPRCLEKEITLSTRHTAHL
ncbi:hypothetical protein BDR06DRAFT_954241 [Suillus hirtellus]|nr:hypothetical protein BDR06DRAFT_954241 [Suillus hirtellus]